MCSAVTEHPERNTSHSSLTHTRRNASHGMFFPTVFPSLPFFIWVGGGDLGFFRAFHLQFSMPAKGVRFSCPGSQARPLSPFRDSPFQVQHPGMGTVQRFSYKLLHLTPGWGCSYPSPGYSWEKKSYGDSSEGKVLLLGQEIPRGWCQAKA